MSTTIDQRVVEMRFDNQNFEKNVSATMSTLEKLKQKLHLTGASKGLENVNSAAKKVDMNGLARSVETVSARFSAMDVIGVTALANITNQAVNAGKRMLSALTIDPVKTGFQEYETQINAVQTILANTSSKGSTIDDVNRALEELNKYADMTIYNFTEMTRNIGTFTAAGIDLDTSVNAIQGIANLAAVSGSTSQQASTAMYQLSQALASGTVKLMDWNSVVNAGMGGEMFQNALKETSKELGTGAEAAIKASGSFRESLRDGWLTSEVLTETLKKFTTSGANEYIAEYTGLSKEAVEAEVKKAKATGDSATAMDRAAESIANMSGKSKDEIKTALEFAQTAEDAATKVKTFTQLWDVLKESAQSGWSQSWKIIVGDFEEAKSLLTPLADFLTGVINGFSDTRNAILESALGKSFTGLLDNIKTSADGVKEVVNSVKDYAAVVDEIIGGKWGNGQERWDKLAESGYDWAHAQNLVNEKLGDSTRHATNYKEAQDSASKSTEKMSETTTDLIVELAELSTTEEGIAELRKKGYTDEQIQAFRELADAAEKTGIPLKDFINNIDSIDGRWLLIDSFKNAGKGLVAVFTAIGDAWRKAFHGDASDDEILAKRSEGLFNLIAAVHKFSTKLVVSEETVKNITRTFKGLFAIVDIVTTVIGGGFKIAFKVLSSVLSYFNMDVWELTAIIGDALVKFRDWFDSLFDISGILDKIVPFISNAVKAVKGWFEAFKESSVVQDFISNISGSFTELLLSIKKIGGIKGLFTNIIKAIVSPFKNIDLKVEGKNIVSGLANGLVDGAGKVISYIIELATDLINAFKEKIDSHSPSKVFMAIGGFIVAGLILGLKEGFVSVPESLQGIVDKCLNVIKNIDWGTVFAFGVSVGALLFLKKIGDALEAFSAPFGKLGDLMESFQGVVESFGNVTKALATNIKSKALKNLAVSLLMIAGAVAVLSFLDPAKLWNAVGIIVVLAGVLVALAWATGKMSDASVDIGKNGVNVNGLKSSLVTIGLAVLMLAATVKLIGSMDTNEAIQGFVGLVGIMGAIVLFGWACQKVTKGNFDENISKVGGLMIKLAIAMALMIGVTKLAGKLSTDDMIKGGIFAAAFAAFIFALRLATLGSTEHINKLGGLMIKLGIAMALMIGVVKLVDTLSPTEMLKGVIFAAAFVLFIKGLVKATAIGNDQQIAKLGGLLLSISISMIMMVGICKLAGHLSAEEMIKGAIFAGAFILFVKGLVKVTSVGSEQQMAKVAGTIFALSFAIGILAVVCMMMSLMNWEGLAKGLIGIGLLSSFIALVVHASKGVNDIKGTFLGIAIAIGVIAVAVAALSLIPVDKLAGATLAMSLLMASFSLIVKSAKGVEKCIGTIITMTIAVAAMAGVLWLLSTLDVQASLTNAAALSLLLVAVSGSMLILSKMNMKIGDALKAVLFLTLMAVPMLAFVGVLALMNKVENALVNATILTDLMTRMTLLLIPLTVVGYLWPGALIGLGALTLMAVPMLAFVSVLALMNKIQNATVNATLLISLMTVMTNMLVKLAIVGPLALIGVAAMSGLTLLMVEIGLLAVAVGALMEKFPSIQKFLDTGLPVLEQLAGSIGTMVGKFIGGIGEGLGDSLVKIGEDITAFMKSLQEAGQYADGVKAESFTGVKELIGALVDVGKATVGLTFADLFTSGGTSMEKFETDGKAFFKALKAISGEMTGFVMPEGFSAEALKTLVDAIKTVGMSTIGMSFADLFAGDQSAMEKFESDGKAFFKALKGISAEMTGFVLPDDFSTDALTTLLDSIKSVGKSIIGISFADFFATGDQTAMEKFETDGKAFFKALKAISGEMTGFVMPEGFSEDALVTLLDALKKVGKSTIGVSFADLFATGDQTAMEKFKSDGVALFSALKAISDEAAGINDDAIARIKSLIEQTKDIDYSGVEKFTGIGTGGVGADGPLHDMGVAIKDFGDQVANINLEAIKISVSAAVKIKNLISNLANLDTSGIDNFKIEEIGTAMKDYNSQVKNIDTSVVSSSVTSAKRLLALINSLVGIDNSGIALFNVKSIGEKMKAYADSVADIDSETVSSSISIANKLKNLITDLAGLDTSGVSSFKSAVESLGTIQVGNLEEVFGNAVSSLKNIGGKMIEGIASGMRSKQSNVISAANNIIKSLYKLITSKMNMFKTAGAGLMSKMTSGIASKSSSMKSALITAIASAVSTIRLYYNSFYSAGSYLVDGFASGISANSFKAAAKARAMAEAAIEAAREALDINSPSKVFRALGYSVPEGFAMGITKLSGLAGKAAVGMTDATLDTVKSSIARIAEAVNSDIDTQPTIRPVLDLSNVRSGASSIGSMLGFGSSIGVMSNVGAISSMMNANIQNGSNRDVVSAINDLKKTLGGVSGNTYNIEGITYDDGSNVSSAVAELVRAARKERRI